MGLTLTFSVTLVVCDLRSTQAAWGCGCLRVSDGPDMDIVCDFAFVCDLGSAHFLPHGGVIVTVHEMGLTLTLSVTLVVCDLGSAQTAWGRDCHCA